MIMEHRVMGRMERVEKRKKVCATSSHGDPTPSASSREKICTADTTA